MYRIGLTGGIATGKSRVLTRFAEAGFHTLDLDVVAHDVIEPGRPANDEIRAAFGPSVIGPNGAIDRRALGAIVFSDVTARERLNAIVHPRVFEEEERRIAAMDPAVSSIVVTDATLLVETGHHLRFDRLVVTVCSRRHQIARIMNRDGLSAGAAQARVAAQMPAEDKARYGHLVIDTTEGTQDTDAGARGAAHLLKGRAAARSAPVIVPRERAIACLAQGPAVGPRGLTPAALAETIARRGWPPMVELARALTPPASGAWYEADEPEDAIGPEALAAPIVLWSLARHGDDVDNIAAAAASMARLTHRRPEALADAITFALALGEVARAAAVPPDLADRMQGLARLIQRWAHAAPTPALLDVLARAADPAASANDARIGALRGLASGASAASAPPDVVDAVDALLALKR